MKNFEFNEFKELISRKNHDMEFSWNGKNYWLNTLEDSICISIVQNKVVISCDYFHPESKDFSKMIDEFLIKKLFDGKSLSEIESEIEVVSHT